jgi:hypothetical protein
MHLSYVLAIVLMAMFLREMKTYIHTKTYLWLYPAIKRSEIMIKATSWMDLKVIMLNENSISKGHIYMIPLLNNILKL